MGGAGLRGARTEWRCAGVVDAAAVASGEMNEDPLDDLGSVDARGDAQRAATHTTVFKFDVEHALEPSHPAHGRRRRMGFAGAGRRLRILARWYIEAGGRESLMRRPTTRLRAELLSLAGIGPETAEDILAYPFARPVFVVDTYARRIL